MPSAKTTMKPPKKVVPEPCCDSDKSDCYKPSNIITKVQKEQELENKKRKQGEDVENLPCCPLCWLSLDIISTASLDHVHVMSPGKQAHNHVHVPMVIQGIIDSDNDPKSENWVNPSNVDVCEKCGKPHVDANKKSCKLVLMQCHIEFDKPKRTFGCCKWFHIGFIGRKKVPDKEAWGACQECCMELDLDGISVDRTCLEFPPKDIDDGFDVAKAKKASVEDSQPNKGNDEVEDVVENNSADESRDDDNKRGSADDSKSNPAVDDVKDDSANDEDAEDDSKATAKVDGDSKDNQDHSNENFCPVNNDVDES